MSGGKGGSQSTSVQIPDWLEEPSRRAIQRGEDIAQIGYQPYMGPDVAGLSHGQRTAMGNTNAAAKAFGMRQMVVPGGGDLSSFETFDSAVRRGRQADPQQAAQYDAIFGSPGTGRGDQGSPLFTSSSAGKGGGKS